ncbi:enolase C-terminal domain-like protein [Hymenobacter siberiensis]|uniref:enolase C-terminal domain-like protein n=1 Tax=Hymenobacter siberiensis TaxID=2848396 RepID=UPI00293D3CF0|nr:enolase C-terminal domain-like protein [Hymenobacter siberiensis]
MRAASPIPIMAVESCGDEHDAARLIQLQACQMLNIKLGKSSGFHRAQKIAQLGQAAGLTLQVGGFLESRLGMTAAAHLALSNPAIQHCDFDTPLMFAADPVVGGFRYRPGRWHRRGLAAPRRAGAFLISRPCSRFVPTISQALLPRLVGLSRTTA